MLRSRPLIYLGLLVPLVVASAEAREATPPLGQLGQYLPGDVWVYNCVVHTPSRDFLKPHWDRVFGALKSSGIEQELKRVIAAELHGKKKESFEQFWQTVTDLIQSVKWYDLIAEEVAFGERFGGLMPDIIVLFKPDAKTRDQNVAGLAKILKTLASFNTNGEVTFSESTVDSVRTWALEVQDAPINVYLLHRRDVVAIIMGRSAMTDVRSLLAGRPDAPTPITAMPRFRAAMAQVPVPEFMLSFVDSDHLLTAMGRLPEMMFGHKETPAEFASVGKKLIQHVIGHINFVDYGVVVGHMDGRRELTDSYFKMKADCHSKCLYRMLVNRKPIDEFHRYVPVDAQGFAASTFMDLGVLYETILDTIRTILPEGESICDQWTQLQTDWDFNVQEDFLSWFSGEMISVSLPAGAPSPFGTGEGVVLFRVRDAAKAAAKIDAGLTRAQAFLTKHGQVFAFDKAEGIPGRGFKAVVHPMFAAFMLRPCIGIWDEWLVIATSEQAVVKVMDTHAGKRKTILDNPRFKREGLCPEGAVASVSFTDLSDFGEQMTGLFVGIGFFGAMLPDEPEARPLKAIVNSIGRLGPVFAEIDFFSSKACHTTFTDGAWISRTLITYKPAETGGANR